MLMSKEKYLPFLMWSLPLSFFTYQFILRLWPGLMMQDIMSQFNIDATAFGFMASAYYYGYSIMQIPLAMAIERFGSRIVIFICVITCGLATLMFTYTSNWYLALLARFLIGGGSAIGILGTSKIISQWFSHDKYASMIGFTFTIGLLGAIYGGAPINLLIDNFGWQHVATVLSFIAIVIAISIYVFLRTPISQQNITPIKLSDLKQLLRSRAIWSLAIVNFLMVGTLEGFADVWGIPYLMEIKHITKSEAATLVSFIFVGMIFGGPILAKLGDRFGSYWTIGACGVLLTFIMILLILFGVILSWYILVSMFILLGILCCYQVLIFTAGANLVEKELLGITIAFLNSINMLGGSFFHSLIGIFMNFFKEEEMVDNMIHYSIDSYNYALLIIPVSSGVGAIIIIIMGIYLNKQSYKECLV